MTPERWQKIEQLYHEAMEHDPMQRTAFLVDACAQDQDLLKAVTDLIAADQGAGSFLAKPALDLANQYHPATTEISLAKPALLTTGQKLGHYHVITKLGAGGMGEVWLAEDNTLRRRVALKLLLLQFTAHSERVRRFEQEARAASALNHPNIITVHEIGATENLHYLVTEFVEGQTVRELLANGALPLFQALDITIQIAAALTAAHKSGIIHRDIKPENVMVRRDGYVKVLDFGLAKLTEIPSLTSNNEAQTIAKITTEIGTVLGTASYMSPEQARGLKVDAKSDLFSLGVVLYEMIMGHRPFAGDTTMDILAAILYETPNPLINVQYADKTLWLKLQTIVNKLLSKKPDERYETAYDLQIELINLKQEIEFKQKISNSQPLTTRNISTVEQSTASPTAENQTQTTMKLAAVEMLEQDTALLVKSAAGINTVQTKDYSIIEFLKRNKLTATLILSVLALTLAVGTFSLYRKFSESLAIKTVQDIKLTRLTAAGNSFLDGAIPAISPNGQYAAYVNVEGSLQSLWVKQIVTGSVVQLIPPANVSYAGQTFSPDSSYIYYVISDSKTLPTLHKIPSLGGATLRILPDVGTAISFNPAGDKFAYASASAGNLFIADADGNNVKEVAKPQNKIHISYLAWSPDGQTIACAAPAAKNSAELFIVNVADGKTQPLSATKLTRISGIGWLPNGKEIITSAAETGTRNYQLWAISIPAGITTKMTNDLSTYRGVSISSDGKSLVSSRHERSVNLWVTSIDDASNAKQLNAENGVDDGIDGLAWTPDNKIVFTARNQEKADLWIIDANGSNRKQLTFNSERNILPTVSSDGHNIVFTAIRSGKKASLWKMDIDGANPAQITDDSGDALRPEWSADGKRIVYELNRNNQSSIWLYELQSSKSVQLSTIIAERPAISSDGNFVAVRTGDGTQSAPQQITILSLQNGSLVKQLNFPAIIKSALIRWMPKERSIAYLDAQDKVSNVFSQSISGGQPKQLTNFKSDRIYYFAISPDGKQIVCARGRETADLVLASNFQ